CHEVLSESLLDYLSYGSSAAPFTIYDGMNHVMRGMYFTFGPGDDSRCGQLVACKYFNPNTHPERELDRSQDSIAAHVRLAVQRQLVSDVPLGVFLSGGADSSVIAACARQFGPVQTFSIGFDDPRYDETKFAQAVAKHLG